MVATAWDIQLSSEFGEPFTVHGVAVSHGHSMVGYGIVDRLRADLAVLLSNRKAAMVEAIYDRAGFASNPHARIRRDNLATLFIDHIVEGLREDDFAPLLEWVRELHHITDRRLLSELDIPRMLDAGCALVVNAAASIRDEITDIALFFAELRQQLQGAYVRAALHSTERSKPATPTVRASAPGRLAADVAHALGLGDAARAFMERLEYLHNEGVGAVPADLLGKETPLSKPELELVAQHSDIASDTLARLESLRAIAAVELHREERWNGTGGPTGLEGEQIPLASRIIAVVDAYTQLLAQRRTREEALAALEADAGTNWDPRVVATFSRLLVQ
ncbi:MAG: hypothetical protein KGM44_06230 [bacterium]|nr:hypothetical protein [bacterium]